ncbi:hypothetical protein T03_14469 [Trichinella britovi]|uniref:Uncharacterized protein n=1 Tax=Trichinella britovi TaxID=45882 RepID=A0A0V1B6D8_TRIBR|nr:hypothetical protein T03_14469 [Trichinella britovi]
MPSNHVRRERKETMEQLKILHLPITFGVSEKRLRGQMLDEMRSDTLPGYNVSGRFSSGLRSLPSSEPFLSYP